MRCPHCGDSQKNLDKAHYSVNHEGKFKCLRCGVGGVLKLRDYLKLVSLDQADLVDEESLEDEWEQTLEELMPGPGYSRDSSLDRYHLNIMTGPHKLVDVFLCRTVHGELTGLALVDLENHWRKIVGHKTLGWTGQVLWSTPSSPLRLVEGPYDVLSARDVCTYGLPSARQLRMLKSHHIILCPDGDVWLDSTKKRAILRLLFVTGGANIIGIEMLQDGKDPDEVPVHQRRLVSATDLRRKWKSQQKFQTLSKYRSTQKT